MCGEKHKKQRSTTYQHAEHVDNLAVVDVVHVATFNGRGLGVLLQLGLLAGVDDQAVNPRRVSELRAALEELAWEEETRDVSF